MEPVKFKIERRVDPDEIFKDGSKYYAYVQKHFLGIKYWKFLTWEYSYYLANEAIKEYKRRYSIKYSKPEIVYEEEWNNQ